MTELRGLVLAGGRSVRMKQDKALIEYHGLPQVRWAFELLKPFCSRVFVSVAPGQDDPVRERLPRMVDDTEGLGPAGGMLTAHQREPRSSWLIVACDLPYLDEEVLAHLVRHRDPASIATAFQSAHDDLPEPLCAIWEPSGLRALAKQVAGGRSCPRKTLINGDVCLLPPLRAMALDNINTPAEHLAALGELGRHAD
ncbi:MAG: NTP transferase domain-containing protein [Gammaproteobacteria bacterium]|nr:NTP transferase domain-containing protein [Gammaproteobacteria bacterium]NND59999.1 NTP transferase domain-containing protein [Gammaproteobacteria bacterium]